MIDISTIPIYCINLDRRPERYHFFMNQKGIKSLKTLERFSAIDGSKIQVAGNPQISNQTQHNIMHKTRRSHGEINTVGAIGCSLSHYAVWKRFLETDAPYCLVLEDDAEISEGFSQKVAASASADAEGIPPFDVWMLSYRLYDMTLHAIPKSDWKSPVYFWGTSSYIVSREGAKRLAEGFFPIESHLDKYICLKNALGSLKVVVHPTFKTYTLSRGTDIQLHPCNLCDYPDNFRDGILLQKYLVAGIIGYSAIITLLFFRGGL
jgi:GR25 family glycosyltransferase involved in LPS biosynthesis